MPLPSDDRFFEIAAQNDFPLSVHIGSFMRRQAQPKGSPATGSTGAEWTGLQFCGAAARSKAGGDTLPVVCDLLFSGIFHRQPKLKLVLVEANIGWIPTLLEQADDMYSRYRFYTGAVEQQPEMPSQLFRRNFWASFMIDTVGMDLRHRLNVDHMMWSTDYPHSVTLWPDSDKHIPELTRGLSDDDRDAVLRGNAARVYGFEV